jgi:hypothetical protein
MKTQESLLSDKFNPLRVLKATHFVALIHTSIITRIRIYILIGWVKVVIDEQMDSESKRRNQNTFSHTDYPIAFFKCIYIIKLQ